MGEKKNKKEILEKGEEKKSFEELIGGSIEETKKTQLIHGMKELEDSHSITDLVALIVKKAWESSASDIHIDPQPSSVLIRYRIDGVLHDVLSLKKELHPLIISRIKVLAGLRTDEHFMAQDGRFKVIEGTNEIDLRVSIIPTYHEENVVMRLLVGEARALDLVELGFSARDLDILQRYIKKPYGMILATGPTGSGKTSTLYSILKILNSRNVSIVTIEDPIEYSVAGVTQIQVNTQTNLTFAAGLRSIVRQDPNIIMVGEIRDEETSGIAINAAMTGHLLLSTIHTNDAATTLPRLLDMGAEPFLIASTVNIAIGQRLVRRLCEKCRSQYTLTREETASLSAVIPNELLKKYKSFWKENGCSTCNNTGYTKRSGIFEVLEVTEPIRRLIMRRANADEIRVAAKQGGMTTMLEDGFNKAVAGVTSIAEILRVIRD